MLDDIRIARNAEITATDLQTKNAAEYELDAVVFAIGFDAMSALVQNRYTRKKRGCAG